MARASKSRQVTEFGDFQTPLDLAERCTAILRRMHVTPNSVIEPTCGKGAFVIAAAAAFPDATRIFGFDINRDHLTIARSRISDARVDFREADFFAEDWKGIVTADLGPWLVVGNPPWVTSAELGILASNNLPRKSNFQHRRGFDAITGKANFDISESMLLRCIDWLDDTPGTIAVLCKTAVARKLLVQAWRAGRRLRSAAMYRIDAVAAFGAAVDACFFVVETGGAAMTSECSVYASLDSRTANHVIGFDGNALVSDIARFTRTRILAGDDPKYVWRSGIKHDCAKVMELRIVGDTLENGFGEIVDIDPALIYPMLKSSDVGNGRIQCRYEVVVPQHRVGQSTDRLRDECPRGWDYLQRHAAALDRRASSIYRKAPRFAIFGVGPYSFSPWKVAISGFYKRLDFHVIGPVEGRAVMVDDTVYFLSCSSEKEAHFVHSLLTCDLAQEFYQSIVHWDEKRPITVGMLKRLSLRKVAEALGREREYTLHAGSLAFAKAA